MADSYTASYKNQEPAVQTVETYMKIFLFVIILLVTSPSFAADWLCAAEKKLQSQFKGNEVLDSGGMADSDSLYTISEENGLRELGDDLPMLPNCMWNDQGKPHRCEVGGGVWGGTFILNVETNIFTLFTIESHTDSSTLDKSSNLYVGKCSPL